MSYFNVLVPIPIDRPLTYSFLVPLKDHDVHAADDQKNTTNRQVSPVIGSIVVVPVGDREVIGIVSSFSPKPDEVIKIKPILHILEVPPILQAMLDFIHWVSKYNIIALGSVVKMVLSYRKIHLLEKEVAKQFDEQFSSAVGLSGSHYRRMHSELEQGEQVVSARSVFYIRDTCNRQVAGEVKERNPKLNEAMGFNAKAHRMPDISLSKEQQEIASDILSRSEMLRLNDGHLSDKAILKPASNTSLIHGITGSGKTEVYTYVAQQIIKNGGQVLVLVPEILLTDQLSQRFEGYLGEISSWHSQMTPANRRKIWVGVHGNYANNSRINFVVGARSALFLPFTNLRLIIVDEEHDSSFKQDEGPIYNGRDMAVVRANLEKIPIILCSATPSVESLYNTQSGKYKLYSLHKRYSGVQLPTVEIVQLSHKAILHERSVELLRQTVADGDQALLFVNRRGYAPISMCSSCGYKACCPNCSFHLVYHKRSNNLKCHYCPYTKPYKTLCDGCGKEENELLLGVGAEKVEEEITRNILPNARTLLVTSDTMSDSKKAKDVLAKIMNHEVDIVIGTQMLAKGLHFERLQLVVVIDAISSYMNGDIRAIERTYQLLHQVMGRAGRSERRGAVILQTNDIKNPVLDTIFKTDSKQFYALEMSNRQGADMPPFSKLAAIMISSTDEHKLLQWFRDTMIPAMPRFASNDLYIMGPSPAPIAKIRKFYRYRFIIRAAKSISLQGLIGQWLQGINIPRSFKLKIDIDPYNFL